MSSIEVRLGDSSLAYLVKILASEACANAWGYKEPRSSVLLSEFYRALDSKFTYTLLTKLSGEPIPQLQIPLREELRALSGDLSQKIFTEHSRKKSYLNVLFSKLPIKLRIMIFRVYVRAFAIKQPNHYWNAFWR
jgi:hypothetical protein